MAIASIFLFSGASSVDLWHAADRVFLLFLLFLGFGGVLMDPCLDLSLGLDVLGDGGTEDFRIDPWRWRGFLSSAIHVVGDDAINLGWRPGFLSSDACVKDHDARVGCWVAGRSGRRKIDCRSGQVGGNGFSGGSHGDLVASIAAQYGLGFNWVLWEELHGDFSPMLDGGKGKGCGGSGGGDPAEGGGWLVARLARVCVWALRLLGLEWPSAQNWGLWACFWTVDFLCAVWVSCWAQFDWGFSIWAALMNVDGVDDDMSSSTPKFI